MKVDIENMFDRALRELKLKGDFTGLNGGYMSVATENGEKTLGSSLTTTTDLLSIMKTDALWAANLLYGGR